MHATRLSARLSPDAVIYPDYRRHMEHEIRDADAYADVDETVIYPDYRRGLDTARRDAVAEDDKKVIYPDY